MKTPIKQQTVMMSQASNNHPMAWMHMQNSPMQMPQFPAPTMPYFGYMPMMGGNPQSLDVKPVIGPHGVVTFPYMYGGYPPTIAPNFSFPQEAPPVTASVAFKNPTTSRKRKSVGKDSAHANTAVVESKSHDDSGRMTISPDEEVDGDDEIMESSMNNTTASNLSPLPQMQLVNSADTFCSVPGRLTLLANLKKYRISLAEIQRRLSPPECLNASILGAVLRRAKNKDGGRLLRESLGEQGIVLPSGRRKSAAVTSFTALIEDEALQLGNDFRTITHNHYPFKAAAAYTLSDVRTPTQAQELQLEVFYARRFVQRLLDFHKKDRSPLVDQCPAAVLNPEFQEALTNFSLLTHGFGGMAMQSSLEAITTVLGECNGALNSVISNAATTAAKKVPVTTSSTSQAIELQSID